jgi:hypothetical protein
LLATSALDGFAEPATGTLAAREAAAAASVGCRDGQW